MTNQEYKEFILEDEKAIQTTDLQNRSEHVDLVFLQDAKFELDSSRGTNYSSTVPFKFPKDTKEKDFIPCPINFQIREFMNNIREPLYGSFLPGFDLEKFEKERNRPFLRYIPYVHRKKLSPIRLPTDIPENQKLFDPNILKTSHKRIAMIAFGNLKLSPQKSSILCQRISKFKRIEILIVKACRINSVKHFRFPRLRICDFSNNNLKNKKTLITFLRKSPGLEILNLIGNPVAKTKNFRPLILYHCRRMSLLNRQRVTIKERMSSIKKYGNKTINSKLGRIRFDLIISSLPVIRSMTVWNPNNVVRLILPSLKISEFHVGSFFSLQLLDLSKNNIEKMMGAGLENCVRLLDLNLSNNKIKNLNQVLNVVPYCASLQNLNIEHNPNLKEYRLDVIYACRELKGTNRQPGLAKFDEAPVDLDEYLLAMKAKGGKNKKEIEDMKWKFAQISYFGNYQIHQIQGFCENVNLANFSNFNLKIIDLMRYPKLIILKLRNNNLKRIKGLGNLPNLQLLDLSCNPKLDLKNTLNQLSKNRNLVNVSFAKDLRITMEGELMNEGYEEVVNSEPLSIYNKEYRVVTLSTLLKSNVNLSILDALNITFEDRISSLEQISEEISYSRKAIEQYKFLLGIKYCVVPAELRTYHFSQVKLNDQYDTSNIIQLNKLNGLGLKDGFCDFSAFVNLEELNLSDNGIKNIFNLGLDNLKNLRIVDLSFNRINNTIKEIANWIGQMGSLEIICLRGNPCLKKKQKIKKDRENVRQKGGTKDNESRNRNNLLSLITNLQNRDCRLRVIDTEITITERVDAWKARGATDEQCNELRFQTTIHTRLSREALSNLESVKVLDLSDAELKQISITEFPNLRRLSLKNNFFKEARNIKGLSGLEELKVLDLRSNRIKNPKSFIKLINDNLPHLVSIGMASNPFTKVRRKSRSSNSDKTKLQAYRQDFLNKLTCLMDPSCVLQQLDSIEIKIEEMICIVKHNKTEQRLKKFNFEEFRSKVTINRRLPKRKKKSSFTEINLQSCGLTTINLMKFINLVTLSLRENKLTDATLTQNNFISLSKLKTLDLRDNRIKSVQSYGTIVSVLPELKSLFITGNPSCQDNNSKARIKIISNTPSLMQVGCKLEYLNGQLIHIKEICQAITLNSSSNKNKNKNKNNKKKIKNRMINYERHRFNIIIEKLMIDPGTCHNLNLTGYSLQYLGSVNKFESLQKLCLQKNRLRTLKNQNLDQLKTLRYLDLQNNKIESVDEMINELIEIPNLRFLYIKNATRNSDLSNPKSYVKDVCLKLRGLQMLDGIKNPFPLDQAQSSALKELEIITDHVGGNPNKVTCMDLSKQNFSVNLFGPILQQLAQLPVKELYMSGNDWEQMDGYRFLVVHSIKTLQYLDGIMVTMAQRDNALSYYESQLSKKGKDKAGLISAIFGMGLGSAGLDGKTQQERDNEFKNRAMSNVKENVDPNDLHNARNNANRNLSHGVQYTKKELQRINFQKQYKRFQPLGTNITKLEIIVSFFQILGLLISLIDSSIWPKIFIDLSWITFPFAIDIDFLIIVFNINIPISFQYTKFTIFMAFPVIIMAIYYIKIDRKKWKRKYITNWKRTKLKIVLAWLLGTATCVFGGFLSDYGKFKNQSNTSYEWTETQIGLAIVFSGIYTFIVFLYYFNARTFRRHQSDKYWFGLNKYKKRISLFLFTIMYMPLARVILYNFRCDSKREKLIIWEDKKCPKSLADLEAIHYLSIVFGLFYIIGIPILFFVLINKRVEEVIKCYKLDEKNEKLKLMKKNKTKDKRYIKNKKKKYKEEYKRRVKEFKSPESYLYDAHTKQFKFYKPIQMVERFLYLILTVFYGAGKLLGFAAFIVIFIFTSIALIFRPFSDYVEDLLDDVGKLVNCVSIMIGTMLAYNIKNLSENLAGWVLVLCNTFFLVAICGAFLLNPIRKKRAKKKAKGYLKKKRRDKIRRNKKRRLEEKKKREKEAKKKRKETISQRKKKNKSKSISNSKQKSKIVLVSDSKSTSNSDSDSDSDSNSNTYSDSDSNTFSDTDGLIKLEDLHSNELLNSQSSEDELTKKKRTKTVLQQQGFYVSDGEQSLGDLTDLSENLDDDDDDEDDDDDDEINKVDESKFDEEIVSDNEIQKDWLVTDIQNEIKDNYNYIPSKRGKNGTLITPDEFDLVKEKK
ncbi:dynein assembly factor 1 axonemal [Anaeramoeba flamelloides]|uniref:Dynein assembly factor 1 axonemal n=1 Tax=Anaeramoeba flamelloides TaxID=1746091 RepID=A0AAV7Y6X7_9EUKA|nr:dynein assembly factor 1 axonemal [Anaeramoeba flamelloides]